MIQTTNNADLLSLYNNKEFNKVINLSKDLIEKDAGNLYAYNILALSYKNLGQPEKAENIFFSVIRENLRNPKISFIYSNAANLLYETGRVDKAMVFHKAALELDPGNLQSSLGLGLSFSNSGKDQDAIDIYKLALKNNNDDTSLNFNLAQSLRKLERFKEAVIYYSKSDKLISKSYKLECLYQSIQNDVDEKVFFKFLKKLNTLNHNDPLVSCLSSHSSIRFSKKDNCKFCKKPFDYIKKYNIFENSLVDDDFVNELLFDIRRSGISEKAQSLLKNGLQTSGNLLKLEYNSIKKLKEIITENIIKYKKNYEKEDDSIIKAWPKKANLYAWLITMKSGGNLMPHMHKEGWLSSSIYLKRPKKNDLYDGDIKFSLDGAGYNNGGKKYPETILEISYGDMVVFPSSLFHSTIPFASNEDRVTLAFDIIPEYD